MEKLVSEKGAVVQALSYREKPKGDREYEIKIAFIVSKLRKRSDLKIVQKQLEQTATARLSKYSQSLFDSCFKNW